MPPIRAVTAPGETLVEVLVDGFYEDPFMSWIFVDLETRGEALAKWFRFWIELYGSDGRMFLTEDDSAASLWAMPEARGVDADVMSDFIALIAPWNGERTTLVLEGLGGLAQHPDETHWYLNAIAARRGRQGAGLGAQLLEPMLEEADAAHTSVYLDSSNPRNLSFYYRHGFEPHRDCVVMPEGDARVQPMFRTAR